MLYRRNINGLKAALARQAAAALVGPRQVGKTTLALQLADEVPSVYIDLEATQDRLKLREASLFLSQFEDRLVVIDEIHRMPELFATLRSLIDRGRRKGRRTGRFLLLGSASLDLLRQSGETLAGRIAHVELDPFDVLEAAQSTADVANLWVRGGFPDSALAANDHLSFAWRRDFLRSYLERDIPMLGPQIPFETLERFWTMLAHSQGALLNASRLASALMVSGQTIGRYVDLLVDLLLVRRLVPFGGNAGKRVVKSPKVYVRDSGVVHALLGIGDFNALSGHPVAGMSWEGFVIENLVNVAPDRTIPSFYRTSAGAEIDLLLEIPGHGLWAIDIKRGLSARPEKGFYIACDDLRPARRFALNAGEERYRITHNTEVIGLRELAGELAALEPTRPSP